MFSSSGYFRGVNCPFFSNGLCERPYCHFRHSAESATTPSLSSTDIPGLASTIEGEASRNDVQAKSSSLLGMVGSALLQVQTPTYCPTPIVKDKASSQGYNNHVKLSSSRQTYSITSRRYEPPSNTPQYNPTPIKVLQASKANVSSSGTQPDRSRITLGDADVRASSSTIGVKRPSVDEQQSCTKKSKVTDPSPEKNDADSNSLKDNSNTVVSTEGTQNDSLQVVEVNSTTEIGDCDKEVKTGELETRKNIFDIMKPKELAEKVKHEQMDVDCTTSQLKSSSVKSEDSDVTGMKTESTVKMSEVPSSNKCESNSVCNKENVMNDNCIESLVQEDASKSSDKKAKVNETSDCDVVPSKAKDQSEDKPERSTGSSKSSSRHSRQSSTETESKSHRVSSRKHSESSKHDSNSRHSSQNSSRHSHSSSKPSSSSRHSSSHRSRSGSSRQSDNHSKSSSHRSSRQNDNSRSSSKHREKDSRSSSRHRDNHSRSPKHHDHNSRSSSSNHRHSRSSSRHSKSPPPESDGSPIFDRRMSQSDDALNSPHTMLPSSVSRKSPSKHNSASSHLSKPNLDGCSSLTSSKKIGQKLDLKESHGSTTPKSSPVKADLNRSITQELFGADSDGDECIVTQVTGPSVPWHEVDSDSDSVILLSSTDDDDEPCLITNAPDRCTETFNDSDSDELPSMLGKKRLAHKTDSKSLSSGLVKKPEPQPPAAQVMLNRFTEFTKTVSNHVKVTSLDGRSRIAHTPTKLSSNADESGSTNKQRIAHVPKAVVVRRPIAGAGNNKIPTSLRQRYLNLFCDKLVTLYPSEKDAYDRAVVEETAIFDKCPSRNIYLNKAAAALRRIKEESNTPSTPTKPRTDKNPLATSHEAVLGGAKAANTSFTVHRSGGPLNNTADVKLTEEVFVGHLLRYKMTEEQLVANGYPHRDPDNPDLVIINKEQQTKKPSAHGSERVCGRCGRRFQVCDDGRHLRQEQCVHHWGKAWKRRVAGSLETRFTCCQQDAGAKGCEVAKFHVHDVNRLSDLSGYIDTVPTSQFDQDMSVYSLDCEMVYTTAGLELARVTVIDFNLDTIVEQLVQPDSPVLDYNTRFSGITAADMKDVSTSLKDVQEMLLGLFTANTLLLGHSLESDLMALKLVHPSVVDTSVVFPHRLGPPYKRALKNLMADHLQKIIQDDEGHDSKEDAAACMELMLWKVKQDMKKSHRHSH